VAYSYIGPELTYAVYREGTIGRAKDHLEATAKGLTKQLESIGGRAYVSVNKALVTQASSAIPVVPLYISILYKIMKAKGTHEGCIEQVYRLFNERLYGGELQLDERGRIRVDDWEMKEDIQDEVYGFWKEVNTDNIEQISDITGYRKEFFHLFGFDFPEIDYAEDINPEVGIPSIE
jgi:enoyl-[acyl-carrier protein] reductase / trans-2-enoyl-CoA reductase (NAD+)